MRLFSALGGSIALLVPALVGCARAPKQQLQGRWVGEIANNFSAAQGNRASGWAKGASFEFKGSRVTVTIAAERPRSSTFRVAEAAKGELVVSFLRPQGSEDRVSFRVEGDEHLRWMLGDGRSILLRKASD